MQRFLWAASIASQAILILRLLYVRLARSYPLFVAFLVAAVCCSLVLVRMNVRSGEYTQIWIFTRYVLMCVEALAITEICARTLSGYRTGRVEWLYLFGIAAAVAVAFSAGLLFFDSAPTAKWTEGHHELMRWRRLILTGFFAFLAAFEIHARIWPPNEGRNLKRHRLLALCYFGYLSAAQFVVTIGAPEWIRTVNLIALPVSVACFASWLFVFKPKDEARPTIRATPKRVASIKAQGEAYLEFAKRAGAKVG